VAEPVLNDLDVQAGADQQAGEVVPQVVEPEGVRQALDAWPGGPDRPIDVPRFGLPARPVSYQEAGAEGRHGGGQLHHQLLRDRQRRPGRL
jgi:hypothetical protein